MCWYIFPIYNCYLGCMSKCSSCSNEWSCLTYKTCQNAFQTLSSTGKCYFQCSSGYFKDKTTCGTCSDPNCKLCSLNGTIEQCGLCQNGYFLDLNTYTCVSSCPTMTKQILSFSTSNYSGSSVNYCRPYVNNTTDKYEYYVNPYSSQYFELGTYEFPFKNFDMPSKEVFNFIYSRSTIYTIYIMRNTSMYLHFNTAPIFLLNLLGYYVKPYGPTHLPNPLIYIADIPYIWPDSTWFTITEASYNKTYRVTLGDWSSTESSVTNQKYAIYRTNMYFDQIDFFSTVYSTLISNYFILVNDGYNNIVSYNNGSLTIDGRFIYSQTAYSLEMTNNYFNISLMPNFFFLRFQDNCINVKQADEKATLLLENNTFNAYSVLGSSQFFLSYSMDDVIFRNNTFVNMSYPLIQSRPFLDYQYQSLCDLANRTQNVIFDKNQFINLATSGVLFSINYAQPYKTNRIIQITNNKVTNSTILTDFFQVYVNNETSITFANNSYNKMTVQQNYHFLYYSAPNSNLIFENDTITNCTADDIHLILSATNISMKNIFISNALGSGLAVTTSGIIKISTFKLFAVLNNITIQNSIFYYGKVFLFDSGNKVTITNMLVQKTYVEYTPLLYLTQLQIVDISSLQLTFLYKTSSSLNFLMALPQLKLTNGISNYKISNISLTNSSLPLFSVSSLSFTSTPDNSNYLLQLQNVTITSNQYATTDPIFYFGPIIYKNLAIVLNQFTATNNTLSQGCLIQNYMNIGNFSLINSQFDGNIGQFLYSTPGSKDTSNPLQMFIDSSNFYKNYGKSTALIQLSTNSKIQISNSNFTENYSIGRGSIIFADYELSYGLIIGSKFLHNYAYKGGLFYIQYSSQIEVSQSILKENFAVIGGVAYIDNDGLITINKNTVIERNSAINTCILYIINTIYKSNLDSVTINQNDQTHSLINKKQFLIYDPSVEFLSSTYLTAMKAVSSDVIRAQNRIDDYSISIIQGFIDITSSTVKDNDFFLIANSESEVTLSNSYIKDTVTSGSTISIVSSLLTLKDAKFTNIVRSQNTYTMASSSFFLINLLNKSILKSLGASFSNINGTLLQISNSEVKFNGFLSIDNSYNYDEYNTFISVDSSVFTSNNAIISKIHSQTISPILNFLSSSAVFVNSSINNFDKTLFSFTYGDYSFDNLSINNGSNTQKSQYESVIFEILQANLTISQALISGIYSDFSSPIINMQSEEGEEQKAQLNISSSKFLNNSAKIDAGVIYTYNTHVFINNSIFSFNQALTGDAGALYLECEKTLQNYCNYEITNSNFTNNKAKNNGGAMKYTYHKPLIKGNCIFKENSAIYGADISSYAINMKFYSHSSRMLASTISNEALQNLGFSNIIGIKLSADQVSGQTISENFTLVLIDAAQNEVVTDSTTMATISSIQNGTTLSKTKSVKAVNGLITFDDFSIISQPGEEIFLTITADSINSDYIKEVYQDSVEMNKIVIQIKMRLCISGEYESDDDQCILCPDGSYTLLPNQNKCIECIDNAVCKNGSQISVNKGYWRPNITTDQIFECFNPDACESGYSIQCADGYYGNLCDSCGTFNGINYQRDGIFNCTACIENKYSGLQTFGVIMLLSAYISLNMFFAIKNINQSCTIVIYLRQLTNYFQFVIISLMFELNWSDDVYQFIRYVGFISEGQKFILSVDCYIKNNGIDIHPEYFRLMLVLLFPLGFIIMITLFWLICGSVFKVQQKLRKLIQTIIVLLHIFSPTIAVVTLKMFNCYDGFKDGSSYLMTDLSVKCWEGDHNYYAKRFGAPTILIWLFGMPIILLLYMIKNKKDLYTVEKRAMIGFLYAGLKGCVDSEWYFYKQRFTIRLSPIKMQKLRNLNSFLTQPPQDFQYLNALQLSLFYGGLFFINNVSSTGQTLILILIISFNVLFYLQFLALVFRKQYSKLKHIVYKSILKKGHAAKQEIYMENELHLDNTKDHSKTIIQDNTFDLVGQNGQQKASSPQISPKLEKGQELLQENFGRTTFQNKNSSKLTYGGSEMQSMQSFSPKARDKIIVSMSKQTKKPKDIKDKHLGKVIDEEEQEEEIHIKEFDKPLGKDQTIDLDNSQIPLTNEDQTFDKLNNQEQNMQEEKKSKKYIKVKDKKKQSQLREQEQANQTLNNLIMSSENQRIRAFNNASVVLEDFSQDDQNIQKYYMAKKDKRNQDHSKDEIL